MTISVSAAALEHVSHNYSDRFGHAPALWGRKAVQPKVDLEKALASATWVTPGRIATRDYPDDPRHSTSGTISPASNTSPAEGTQDQLRLNGIAAGCGVSGARMKTCRFPESSPAQDEGFSVFRRRLVASGRVFGLYR